MNGAGSSVAGNPGSGLEVTTPPPASGDGRIPIFVWVLVGVAAFFLLCIVPLFVLLSIPTFGHMKNQANERVALRSMQTIEQAELMYSVTYPSKGYACSLRALGGDPSAGPPSAEAAQVLPGDLASGFKSGYIFNLSNCTRISKNGMERVEGYTVTAVPQTVGKTGNRGFCSDESGVIKYDPAGGSNCTQPLELR
ncbi:MAG: prepilin-type cleavage/methylation domain-containing protein [Terracidiphilus sp.]|jgi:type IV pilus assembly protein PilA